MTVTSVDTVTVTVTMTTPSYLQQVEGEDVGCHGNSRHLVKSIKWHPVEGKEHDQLPGEEEGVQLVR